MTYRTPLRTPAVIWLTGRPASGKTTIARNLWGALQARDIPVLWLDSDDLRPFLTPNATYSTDERDSFYAALGHLAARAAYGGAWVVVSATASLRSHRDAVRARVPRFIEVWVDCPEAVLRARDPKGLYAAADRGELTRLPGIGTPYEPPTSPELHLDTSVLQPREATDRILRVVEGLSRGQIHPATFGHAGR